MQSSAAQTLALNALTHIAGDGQILARFLKISGLEPDDLRQRAGDPELLAAVIDFLLSDESLCTGFLAAERIDAKMLHAARRALPGAPED
jgi:NAD(P)-dependent dehydrogenase (short-subunit alcohol dehydrogenase family)